MDGILNGWQILVGFVSIIGWFFKQEHTLKDHDKTLEEHEEKLDMIHSVDRRLARIEGRLGIEMERDE